MAQVVKNCSPTFGLSSLDQREGAELEASQVSNAIALALSLVAVAVSAVSAFRQATLMQHANLLPVLIDMFRDFREPEFRQHLAFIEEELWDRCPQGVPASTTYRRR